MKLANPLERAEALALINEHCGEQVRVAVELDIGDWYTPVMTGRGKLVQMQPAIGQTPPMPAATDEPPTGLYRAGDMSVLIPEHGIEQIGHSVSGPGVQVRLTDKVGLGIYWGD